MAETTGLLDQTIGPILTTWEGLPIYGKIGLAAGAGIAFLGYHAIQNRSKDDTLEATDWEEKMDNLFKIPSEKTGRPANTLLLNQSDTAGKRTIGVIKKLNTSSVDISSEDLKHAINDKDKWQEMKESGELDIKGVTYAVVPGRKKFGRMVSTILYKLAAIFSKGSNSQAEYFDLTENEIEVTDQGVVIKKDAHLFKENGLWQTSGIENQERKIQLTSTVQLQNYLESLQKHPEFYSDLNMDTSSKKNIMNQKSQNMREYKEAESRKEKKEAME